MKRIWLNVKAGLLPPWVTWVLFDLAVAVYGLLILLEAHNDQFAGHEWSGFWIFVFPLGYFILGRHGLDERAPKPFSFLLPGYREPWRRSSFSRAVRWGVAFSLYVFSESWRRLLLFWTVRQIWSGSPAGVPPDVSLPSAPSVLEVSLSTAGGLLGGMALCLFWTSGSLVHFRRKWLSVLFEGFEFPIIAILIWTPVSKHGFVVWPILILLSVFYCVYFWIHLGNPDWVKSGHRTMIVDAMGGTRGVMVQVNSQRFVAQMRSRRRVENLFLGRIRRAHVRSVARSVWAWLYCTFGPILPYWRWIAIPLLVGVLVQGYVSRSFVELASLVLGGLVAANAGPDISSMLLPEGRKRRYDLTVVAAAFTTLLLLTISAVAIALSWVLAALMPPVSWGTHHWQYTGIHVEILLLVCLLVPWVFLSGPFWHRVPIVRVAITAIVAFLAIGQIFGRDYGFWDVPILLPTLLACGWVLLPLTLWITYRRCDLVGQRPIGAD